MVIREMSLPDVELWLESKSRQLREKALAESRIKPSRLPQLVAVSPVSAPVTTQQESQIGSRVGSKSSVRTSYSTVSTQTELKRKPKK